MDKVTPHFKQLLKDFYIAMSELVESENQLKEFRFETHSIHGSIPSAFTYIDMRSRSSISNPNRFLEEKIERAVKDKLINKTDIPVNVRETLNV